MKRGVANRAGGQDQRGCFFNIEEGTEAAEVTVTEVASTPDAHGKLFDLRQLLPPPGAGWAGWSSD